MERVYLGNAIRLYLIIVMMFTAVKLRQTIRD